MNIDVDEEKVFEMIRRLLERKWYGRIILSVQEGDLCNIKIEESVNLRKVERDNG